MAISRTTLCAVAAALLVSVQAKCDERLSQGFNASGSATASVMGGKWTFTRYVTYNATGENKTLYEPITITTDPAVNLTSDAYEGCILTGVGLHDPTQPPSSDDGTCSNYLGTVCIATIKANLRAAPSTPSKEEYCTAFQAAISKSAATGACPAPILNSFDAQTLTNYTLSDSNASCPVNGTADGSVLASTYINGTANVGMYDQAIGSRTPIFISVRSKGDTGGATVENMAMVCVPAGTVVTGSRTLADAAKEAAAAKASTKPSAADKLGVQIMAVLGVAGVVGAASVLGMFI